MIASLLKKNLKYIVVIFIFGALLYNRISANRIGRDESSNHSVDKNLSIPSDKEKYLVDLETTQPKSNYRLTFRARANSTTSNNSAVSHSSKVSIAMLSELDGVKQLGEKNISYSDQYQSFELLFASDGYYKVASFIRSDSEDKNDVYIKDVTLTSLNLNSNEALNTLKPYLAGDTDLSLAQAKNDKSDRDIYTFGIDKVLVGQVFKANDNFISAASFKVKTKGLGGTDSYIAELHKASLKDGTYQVDPIVLKQFHFKASNPGSVLNNEGDWQFPLAEFVEKGQYYFIGINNEIAGSSKKNSITLVGSAGEDYSDGQAVQIDQNGSKKLGNLYFKVFGAKFSMNEKGEKLPTGSTFQDLGSGRGVYQYSSNQQVTDYLDLDRSSLDQAKVFFSPDTLTILGQVKDNNSFTYRFDTPGLIDRFYFSTDYLDENYYKANVYYSFDNKNWQEILPQSEDEDGLPSPANLSTRIIPKNNSGSTLFIKVTADPNDSNHREGLFGLKNFKLKADVNL